MIRKSDLTALATVVLIGVGGAAATGSAAAQTSPSAAKAEGAPAKAAAADKAQGKPAPRTTAKSSRQKPAPEPEPVIADADPSQIEAVGKVYTGSSDCEFDQKIVVEPSQKHVGYVELQHGKKSWLMRPVVSSTGAVRLEDVRAEALLIQIGSKTMLLNQKTGQRIVDECRHTMQRSPDASVAGGGIGIATDAPATAVAANGGSAPVAMPVSAPATGGTTSTTTTLATPAGPPGVSPAAPATGPAVTTPAK